MTQHGQELIIIESFPTFLSLFSAWYQLDKTKCIPLTNHTQKALATDSSTLAWSGKRRRRRRSPTLLSDFPFTLHFHALEKEMATHSSVLAWRIPGTVEPGGLPSMGSHRIGRNLSDLAAAATTNHRTPTSSWPTYSFLIPTTCNQCKSLSHSFVQLLATPRTVAHQAALSMEFSR